MGYGIEESVQKKVDAYRSNPQALQKRYAQNQDLLDLLALQKIKSQQEAIARDMQMKMNGNPQTIAQQVEQQVLNNTKNNMVQQVGGVLGQKNQQAQKNLQKIANAGQPSKGIAAVPAPNMKKMATGGIVNFSEGGGVDGVTNSGNAYDRNMAPALSPAEKEDIRNKISLIRRNMGTLPKDSEDYKRAQARISELETELSQKDIDVKQLSREEQFRRYIQGLKDANTTQSGVLGGGVQNLSYSTPAVMSQLRKDFMSQFGDEEKSAKVVPEVKTQTQPTVAPQPTQPTVAPQPTQPTVGTGSTIGSDGVPSLLRNIVQPTVAPKPQPTVAPKPQPTQASDPFSSITKPTIEQAKKEGVQLADNEYSRMLRDELEKVLARDPAEEEKARRKEARDYMGLTPEQIARRKARDDKFAAYESEVFDPDSQRMDRVLAGLRGAGGRAGIGSIFGGAGQAAVNERDAQRQAFKRFQEGMATREEGFTTQDLGLRKDAFGAGANVRKDAEIARNTGLQSLTGLSGDVINAARTAFTGRNQQYTQQMANARRILGDQNAMKLAQFKAGKDKELKILENNFKASTMTPKDIQSSLVTITKNRQEALKDIATLRNDALVMARDEAQIKQINEYYDAMADSIKADYSVLEDNVLSNRQSGSIPTISMMNTGQ